MSSTTPQTHPKSLGVIMDGNRRWAKAQGLSTPDGHKKGYETFTDLLKWSDKLGIKTLAVYALSTENLKRPPEEVSYLFTLFKTALEEQIEEIEKQQVRVVFPGARDRLPKDMQKLFNDLEEKTKHHTRRTLLVLAPYGGRAELVAAVNKAIDKGEKVSEESFANLLNTSALPEVDMIIRTGGEKRLSNFLPWQASYAELFFTDTLWPDFSEEEFLAMVEEYGKRNRRFGA